MISEVKLWIFSSGTPTDTGLVYWESYIGFVLPKFWFSQKRKCTDMCSGRTQSTQAQLQNIIGERLGIDSWRGRFTWKWRGEINKIWPLLALVWIRFVLKNDLFTAMEKEEVIISNGDGLQSTQTLFERVMAVCYIETVITVIKDQRKKERLK